MSILTETLAHCHAVLKIRPDWQELRQVRAAPSVISCFLFTLIFLCACTRGGRTPYTLLDITPIPVSAPDGFYQDVTWLEPEMLALEFLATKETKNWESRLMILDLATGESFLLPDEVPQDCHETRYGRFDRLPTGQLGYQRECLPLVGIARDFRLHLWDPITQTDQEIYRYPIPFEATAFSFAPNMDRWLQEQTGDGLFNKLYYVETGQVPVRLLETSFARAGWPSWLPDGRIVFAGTPQLPETKPNIFSGAPALMAQLNQSWNIYLTDLESLMHESVGEEQIVLSGVKGIRGPVVSPDGRALAFLGTYRGHEGLWVYGMDTKKLARVWTGFGPFAWSPDGSELMVLMREPNVEFFLGKPARIKLPDSIISKRPLTSVAGVFRDHPSTRDLRSPLRTSLGSTSIIVNGSGVRIWEDRYLPFGDVRYQWRTGAPPIATQTQYRYTGQRLEAGVGAPSPTTWNGVAVDRGLYFYGARWYDAYMYLVAIMDWFSRYVLAWQLSNTLDTRFCLQALDDALRQGQPQIFNTDQGSQFTSKKFTARLENTGVRISMDGRGRAFDNIFIERLWRTLKYEDIYIKDYESVIALDLDLLSYFHFYNHERPHQSLSYLTPAEVYASPPMMISPQPSLELIACQTSQTG